MSCGKCIGKTKDGKRCKRTASCKIGCGEYCFQHSSNYSKQTRLCKSSSSPKKKDSFDYVPIPDYAYLNESIHHKKVIWANEFPIFESFFNKKGLKALAELRRVPVNSTHTLRGVIRDDGPVYVFFGRSPDHPNNFITTSAIVLAYLEPGAKEGKIATKSGSVYEIIYDPNIGNVVSGRTKF